MSRIHLWAAVGGLLVGLVGGTVVVADVGVQTFDDGSNTPGQVVLVSSFTGGVVTESEVHDGAQNPEPAKLGYDNTDIADAADEFEFGITNHAPFGSDDYMICAKLTVKASVTVLTEQAPGNPNLGTYKTSAGAWYSADLGLGTEVDYQDVTEIIENEESGNITRPRTWKFADIADPTMPRCMWLSPQTSTMFRYNTGAGVALDALRPEVVVGGGAGSYVLSGELVAWDYSDPANPVVATQPNGLDAIWDCK